MTECVIAVLEELNRLIIVNTNLNSPVFMQDVPICNCSWRSLVAGQDQMWQARVTQPLSSLFEC
jgi:hypothetical protein